MIRIFLITIFIMLEIILIVILCKFCNDDRQEKFKVKDKKACKDAKIHVEPVNMTAKTHIDRFVSELNISDGIHLENLKANFRSPYNGYLTVELEDGRILINDELQYELSGRLKNTCIQKGDTIRIISENTPMMAIVHKEKI